MDFYENAYYSASNMSSPNLSNHSTSSFSSASPTLYENHSNFNGFSNSVDQVRITKILNDFPKLNINEKWTLSPFVCVFITLSNILKNSLKSGLRITISFFI